MKKPKRLFNHLNQKLDGYKMGCPIYGAVINLYYNTGIKLVKKDIDKIIAICKKNGFWDEKNGGYMKSCMNEVYNYIAPTHPELGYMVFNKYSPNFKHYFNKKYMMTIGISVNSKWLIDKKDGEINGKEYNNFKGDKLKHITNIMKWDLFNNYFFDSYFGKKDNLYKFNFNQIKDIMMNTTYFFYIK